MKVAIDLTPLYSEHQFRGIGFYTKRLIEGMKNLIDEGEDLELEFIKSIEKLRFIKADLVHYPYFSPFFFTLPRKLLAPGVVTIHDLIPIKDDGHFTPGFKGKLRWQVQKRRLKKIKAVITDSKAWKNDIAILTGFPQEKIFSIPLAAGKEFKILKNRDLGLKIKEKYNLPETFVLYVGDVNWNKNVVGLIRSFSLLIANQSQTGLVLVGKAFRNYNLPEVREIVQLIKALDLDSKIKMLGFVPTEELAVIYNLATVYCQPSFDEGFGLPILEAMACGCPVVAGKAGSLPEVCGPAALTVNPSNIQAIAKGIKTVVESRQMRERMRKKGLKWAKKFDWNKTAKQTVAVYKRVFKNGDI